MPCYTDYITIDPSTPSRSGLYVVNLPGVEIPLLEQLTTEDQEDYLAFWGVIYERAWNNFISDLTDKLQSKFYVDAKLLSRETSQFLADVNASTGLAGVTIEFDLPRYAKLHIVSVDVWSAEEYSSPEATVRVYDTDENGDLLSEHSAEIAVGKNTIFIDTDYEVDKVFVSFEPEVNSFRQTENKRYDVNYIDYSCDTCTFDCGGYTGTVEQINGGGLNVKFNVFCCVNKFACQNINLFKQAIYYRTGLELVYERMLGNRINKYMTMTLERQEELMAFYNTEYMKNLSQAVKAQNMREDPYCFTCKQIVSTRSELP